MNIEQERKALRQQIRKQRQSLSKEFQQQSAELLLQQLKTLLKQGQTIALYLANDGELSPHVVIDKANELNVNVVLPVLHPVRKGYLNFQRFAETTQMTANQYGIAEPKLSSVDTVPLENIDIICLPLVAFDSDGNRLGMGGGYYDRTLAKIGELANPPQLIGLAHDIQQLRKLPVQPWDVPITKIITPKQVIDTSTNT